MVELRTDKQKRVTYGIRCTRFIIVKGRDTKRIVNSDTCSLFPEPVWVGRILAANTEFGDDCLISFKVVFLHIIEKLTTLTCHLDQTPTGMVILAVLPQVFRKVRDFRCKQCDLHFTGAGVLVVSLEFCDDFLFFDCV